MSPILVGETVPSDMCSTFMFDPLMVLLQVLARLVVKGRRQRDRSAHVKMAVFA
jgi:hypothetical protein